METIRFDLKAPDRARGTRALALVRVVASGNLEILLEREAAKGRCTIEIKTAAKGFTALWKAVTDDFVARHPAGGLRISINDMGARPDTVALRLAQGVRLIEEPEA